jgi:hypothetical protein
MKVRNGFVSNSSSSSFVVVIKKEVHDKVLPLLTDYQRMIIEQIAEKDKAFGMDVITIGDMTDHGGESQLFYDLPYDDEKNEEDDDNYREGPYEAYDAYRDLVDKNSTKDEVFSWSMG